jgi:colicin import membrane protein
MSEETWYKMLAVSFALHILFVAAFSIPFKSTKRKIDLSSAYSVNLVGGTGSGGGGQKEATAEAKTIPGKPIPKIKETKPVPVKNKPIPIKKEDLVSLSKKKVPEKAETTKEELEQLQKKIQNLKRKTEYLDVAKSARSGSATSGNTSGAGGFIGSGEGGGGIVDPLMQKYGMDVQEKIQEAWRKPAISKKGLTTVEVAIKIRRDGMVIDMIPEKMSGNRLYDESVLRAIKAAVLPRIPIAIKEDLIEFVVRFSPEDM